MKDVVFLESIWNNATTWYWTYFVNGKEIWEMVWGKLSEKWAPDLFWQWEVVVMFEASDGFGMDVFVRLTKVKDFLWLSVLF